ncbi:unnamed protein product, partial [Amoebophrya sp. A120]|eukprot:GSA120T00023388001.1
MRLLVSYLQSPRAFFFLEQDEDVLLLAKSTEKKMAYYACLNLPADASEADLRKQYKRLARERHPDKSRASSERAATAEFQQLRAAYEVLINPQTRRLYDELLHYANVDAGKHNDVEQNGQQGSSSATTYTSDITALYREYLQTSQFTANDTTKLMRVCETEDLAAVLDLLTEEFPGVFDTKLTVNYLAEDVASRCSSRFNSKVSAYTVSSGAEMLNERKNKASSVASSTKTVVQLPDDSDFESKQIFKAHSDAVEVLGGHDTTNAGLPPDKVGAATFLPSQSKDPLTHSNTQLLNPAEQKRLFDYVNRRSVDTGRTALLCAMRNKDAEERRQIIYLLVQHLNADINAVNAGGFTAAMFAAGMDNTVKDPALLNLLVDLAADVNVQTNYGLTALMIACCKNRRSSKTAHSFFTLLNAKADVRQITDVGFDALAFAADYGNYQLVEVLLQEKADVNLQYFGKYSRTALMCSAALGNVEVLQILLDNKADVELQTTENNDTALDYAGRSFDDGLIVPHGLRNVKLWDALPVPCFPAEFVKRNSPSSPASAAGVTRLLGEDEGKSRELTTAKVSSPSTIEIDIDAVRRSPEFRRFFEEKSGRCCNAPLLMAILRRELRVFVDGGVFFEEEEVEANSSFSQPQGSGSEEIFVQAPSRSCTTRGHDEGAGQGEGDASQKTSDAPPDDPAYVQEPESPRTPSDAAPGNKSEPVPAPPSLTTEQRGKEESASPRISQSGRYPEVVLHPDRAEQEKNIFASALSLLRNLAFVCRCENVESGPRSYRGERNYGSTDMRPPDRSRMHNASQIVS